ncbi:MAG: hypothetical protein GX977_14720 [Firmicutes bacterium]|mgnify:CR=1 FL=1|nr:hypothetical protein [Bacillota bacterium]HHY13747.1 hypothetical protein [Thermoanaerobacterales bacterium]
MIHYVALPIELVVENMGKIDYQFTEVEIDGIKMILEPMDFNKGKIVRIISSDPNDFINPSYQPGQTINLHLK